MSQLVFKRGFFAGISVAALLILSVSVDSGGFGMTGLAHGGGGGCGGTPSEAPAICSTDENCSEGYFCSNNQCLEYSYTNTCLDLGWGDIEYSLADDYDIGLSVFWEDDGYVLSSEKRQTMQSLLSDIYLFFRSEFSFPMISEPVQIRVFSNAESYATCMNYLGKKPNQGPFYSNQLDRIFFLYESDTDWPLTLRILLHEGSHFIFKHDNGGDGIHFNEGLAVFFSTITQGTIDGRNAIQISPHDAKYEPLLDNLVAEDKLFTLDEFLKFSNAEWQKNNNIAYAQSYSLVYFLMERHPHIAEAIMENLKRPAYSRPSYREVIEANYHTRDPDRFAGFESDWVDWLSEKHEPLIYYMP